MKSTYRIGLLVATATVAGVIATTPMIIEAMDANKVEAKVGMVALPDNVLYYLIGITQ